MQPLTPNTGNNGQQWGTGNSGTPLGAPPTELPTPLQEAPVPAEPVRTTPPAPAASPQGQTVTTSEEWVHKVQQVLDSHPGNPRKRVDQLVGLKQQYQHEVLGLPYPPNTNGGQPV